MKKTVGLLLFIIPLHAETTVPQPVKPVTLIARLRDISTHVKRFATSETTLLFTAQVYCLYHCSSRFCRFWKALVTDPNNLICGIEKNKLARALDDGKRNLWFHLIALPSFAYLTIILAKKLPEEWRKQFAPKENTTSDLKNQSLENASLSHDERK